MYLRICLFACLFYVQHCANHVYLTIALSCKSIDAFLDQQRPLVLRCNNYIVIVFIF